VFFIYYWIKELGQWVIIATRRVLPVLGDLKDLKGRLAPLGRLVRKVLRGPLELWGLLDLKGCKAPQVLPEQ
jgi:hypothetical protein